jgi:crotonobetainyl-CoA:carnitine CoA-transferase CaiB-like acyl-CoA transferase
MDDGALADLRVVEWGTGLASAFAAKALADYGADVIKVEPRAGDASRIAGPFPKDVPHHECSGQFLYLNANKRGVTLDLDDPRGRDELHRLLQRADVAITDRPAARLSEIGLRYASLSSRYPRLIVTAISPFGLTGPYRDYKGSDLISWHMGGTGMGTPFNAVTRPHEEPPLRGGGYQAEYVTGWTAAAATLVAVFHRERYGAGQVVDISAMEAVANMMRASFALHSYDPAALPTSRTKVSSSWIYPCKDGYISTSHGRDHWWQALKALMGQPEWAESAAFAAPADRRQNADALDAGLSEWFQGYTRAELFPLLTARGVPCFPVQPIADVVASPQYRARNTLVDQKHPIAGSITQPGPTVRYSETPWRMRRPAPLLGQHNEEVFAQTHETGEDQRVPAQDPRPDAPADPSNRPLHGIRVVDFGWILSVPHCTAWLATLGAEVIRVESMARPDLVRMGLGGSADGIPGINRSGAFNGLNYSKKSITLNIASDAGRDLARTLIATSDVVCENFATGVLGRLGLGYEALRAVRPDLIMLTGSTLGTDGPEREATGWGPNVCAYAGLPFISGYEDGPPADLGGIWPDYCIGTMMVFALLGAVHHRRRTGRGQRVEVAMGEVVTAMIPEAVLDYTVNGRQRPRMGNRDLQMAPHDVYPCQGDDCWVAIAVDSDEAWRALCRVMERPDLAANSAFAAAAGRRQHLDALDAAIGDWTRRHTADEVTQALQAAGVAAGPVMTVAALAADPHLRAREFLVEIDHPEVGRRRVAGLPAKFSRMPELAYGPAPCLGEHNDEVFGDLLSLTQPELRRLQDAQVIY